MQASPVVDDYHLSHQEERGKKREENDRISASSRVQRAVNLEKMSLYKECSSSDESVTLAYESTTECEIDCIKMVKGPLELILTPKKMKIILDLLNTEGIENEDELLQMPEK